MKSRSFIGERKWFTDNKVRTHESTISTQAPLRIGKVVLFGRLAFTFQFISIYLFVIGCCLLSPSIFNSACVFIGSGLSGIVSVMFFVAMPKLDSKYFENFQFQLGSSSIVNLACGTVLYVTYIFFCF